MYPKVVRARGLLYFPCRRAASSAIQNVMGIDFVDWRVAIAMPDTFHRFTYYRNTYDKFRSLFHSFINPAPLGRVNFGLELRDEPTFDEFIYLISETNDATCDEHLVSQNWEDFIPELTIYYNMQFLENGTGLIIPPFGSYAGDLSYLKFRGTARREFETRYHDEIYRHEFVDYYANVVSIPKH